MAGDSAGAAAHAEALGLDELANLGGDLLAEALDGGVVAGEDEAGDAVLQRQLGEEAGAGVARPMLSSRRTAAGRGLPPGRSRR